MPWFCLDVKINAHKEHTAQNAPTVASAKTMEPVMRQVGNAIAHQAGG